MFAIKEKVEAVKQIPNQIVNTMKIAIAALIIAIAAFAYAIGSRYAH